MVVQIPNNKPYLDPQKRKKRRAWAAQYGDYEFQQGIYVDEAMLYRNGNIRCWVTREDEEAGHPSCLTPKLPGSKQGFMIWGAIWYGGRSKLVRFDCAESQGKKGGVTARLYRDQVTKGPLLEAWKKVTHSWRGYGGEVLILEDNCAVHKGEAVIEAERLHLKFFDHPPSSPDLNPIEHCWAWLKHELRLQCGSNSTFDQLFETAARLWEEMPQEVIDGCIDGLYVRREIVKKRQGWHADL